MSVKLSPKPRLGRGLSSLISVNQDLPVEVELPSNPPVTLPVSAMPAAPSFTPPAHEIPMSAIAPNPHQPRKTIDEAALAELAASIKVAGLIQPIIVRKIGDSFQLIAGERRFRACKLAGMEKIPAVIRENIDELTQAQLALIENIQREDLNPIERALGYRTLIDEMGLTQNDLASRLGEDRSSIANHLRLLELAEPVRLLVRDGRLSFGHAKLLAGVTDILEQERLAKLTVAQDLSVRNLERIMKGGTTAPAKPSGPSAHILDLEKSLTRQLGMKVQVRSASRKGRGRLIIHYSSLDQFDDVVARLGLKTE